MDSQRTAEVKSSSQASHKIQSKHQSPTVSETLEPDPGQSLILCSNDKKISHEDIGLVQNLIEHCLQLYMNKKEVIRTLSIRAKVEPEFTALVWQKLEEENSEFFRSYYIRVKLKKQIILFNQLLQHQYNLTICSSPNGVQPTAAFQPPRCSPQLHVNNGKPSPGTSQLSWLNNDGTSEAAAPAPEGSAMASMSEIAMRPSPVASNNHFPLTPLELSMGMDSPALGSTFTSDVHVGELETRLDVDFASSRDSTRSLSHIWNFSLSDLTTDCENLDLGAIGDYSGSPFLSFGSDLLLDLPVEDDVVEYFADQISGSSLQSGEDKAYINRAEETN
ncbi:uncharacterized protein LOC121997734 [Zingiber officinale]|uniref:uncharacterized protein LOC121997734 n=1 Tax=Zingiber officinale TaxID=94328 RepID=UPI001C4AFF02|nr:uncharacterized protein LOC121997734 [Zingiber officinale]